MKFHNTGLGWLDELNVLVDYDDRPISELSENGCSDEDHLVLTNTSVYEYIESLNVMREVNIEAELNTIWNERIPIFLFDGKKIRIATIKITY